MTSKSGKNKNVAHEEHVEKIRNFLQRCPMHVELAITLHINILLLNIHKHEQI